MSEQEPSALDWWRVPGEAWSAWWRRRMVRESREALERHETALSRQCPDPAFVEPKQFPD